MHESNEPEDKGIHRQLSYRVMQAVFEVHNTLGPGFGERVYQEALTHELESRSKPFERQKEVRAYYEECVVDVHRPGSVVDGKIVLELKAVSALSDLFKQ